MNKKMRELQAKKLQKIEEAKGFMDGEAKDLDRAEALLNEADGIQKEIDLEARIENAGKAEAEGKGLESPRKPNGFVAMVKAMFGRSMTDDEKALVTGSAAENGENLLIPEDVRAAIIEKRRSYVSAKDIVTVEETSSLTGSVNVETGEITELTDFEDGDDVPADALPKFANKKFTIVFRGVLIPISRILQGSEKGGLMRYLDRWFVKKAVLTENKKIFAALKSGYNDGTPKALTGWRELKKSINKDLDPAVKANGFVVTNQSGFACLDDEVDGDNRPILQPDPAKPTEKLFQGMPVKVYPDNQLPNIDETHFPVIYGDTKSGALFVEHTSLEFRASEHALFGKNQNCLRVIEGFDVMGVDGEGYIYGSFTASA